MATVKEELALVSHKLEKEQISEVIVPKWTEVVQKEVNTQLTRMDERISKVTENIAKSMTNVLSTHQKLIERRMNNVNKFESDEEFKKDQVDDGYLVTKDVLTIG